MDIADFLLARIAEDEAAAQMPPPGPWDFNGPARETDLFSVPTGVSVAHVWQRDAHHIARWDPARVLAECEAKRAIVQLWQFCDMTARGAHDPDKARSARDTRAGLHAVLLALALPYAEHVDFDPAWSVAATV